jgi:glycosyltransferase involved in cell wall biosynthesis
VLWLTSEIWPLVVERCPDAKLVIVGRHPVDEVVRAAADSGASLEADVEDVRPYYWKAAVLVAPIRLGSGLRNKVLHAMACEAPVVATPTALEGMDAESGRHLLVASDARGFADAIVETLDDPEAARERVAAARAFVEGFRGRAVADKLEAWWQRRS